MCDFERIRTTQPKARHLQVPPHLSLSPPPLAINFPPQSFSFSIVLRPSHKYFFGEKKQRITHTASPSDSITTHFSGSANNVRLSHSLKLAIDNQESVVREIKPRNMRIVGDEEDYKWPPWLKPLLKEHFFVNCKLHADSHKSECNMYCLDCMNGPLCSLCLAYHKDHRAIQIRRSSYHDVIRVSEIHKYLDISSVQTYIINSAKVVFLNERPQPRPGKGVTNTCQVCDRTLLDSFRFCSLGCKIAGISKNLQKSSRSMAEDFDDSLSSSSSADGRRLRFRPSTPPPTAAIYRTAKRRKGIPHRAPTGGLHYQYSLLYNGKLPIQSEG